jgi:hypothetical protein
MVQWTRQIPSLLAAAGRLQKSAGDAGANEPVANVFKFADGQVWTQLTSFPRLNAAFAINATLPVRCGARDAYLPIRPHYSELNGEGSVRSFIGRYYPDLPLDCKVVVGSTLADVSARILPLTPTAPTAAERALLRALDHAAVVNLSAEAVGDGSDAPWRDPDWDWVLSQANGHLLDQDLRSANVEGLSAYPTQPDVFLVFAIGSNDQFRRLHYTLQSLNLALVSRVFVFVSGGSDADKYDQSQVDTLRTQYPNVIVLQLDAEAEDGSENTENPENVNLEAIQRILNAPLSKLVATNVIVRLVKESMLEDEQKAAEGAAAPNINAENDIYIMLSPDYAYTRNTIDAFVAEALASPQAVIIGAEANANSVEVRTFGLPVFKPLDFDAAGGIALRAFHFDVPVAKKLTAMHACASDKGTVLGLMLKLSDFERVALGTKVSPPANGKDSKTSSLSTAYYSPEMAQPFPVSHDLAQEGPLLACEAELIKHLVDWSSLNKRLRSRHEFIN